MAEKSTVEVLIAPRRIISVTGELRDIFAIAKALKADYDPKIRYHDPELGDVTCWQPITSLPEAKKGKPI